MAPKEDNRETEVKFSVLSAEAIRSMAEDAGAVCEQEPVLERNLRFDDAQKTLCKNNQVLRLRDNGGTAILTFKSDRFSSERLADREEIETVVEDFDRTLLILERLGYGIFFIYEKIRSIWKLDETEIYFDHTPIGDFVEIEGVDEEHIRRTAEKIGLRWETRSGKGYRAVFNKWKKETGYPGRDMTFTEITAWKKAE